MTNKKDDIYEDFSRAITGELHIPNLKKIETLGLLYGIERRQKESDKKLKERISSMIEDNQRILFRKELNQVIKERRMILMNPYVRAIEDFAFIHGEDKEIIVLLYTTKNDLNKEKKDMTNPRRIKLQTKF